MVACEESQRVCISFRERGHEAYSCDIQECSGGHPEWHIRGDVLPLLNGNCQFVTSGGQNVTIDGKWDLIIAHPPCTFLSNVAMKHFSLKYNSAQYVVDRCNNRAKAAVFFMRFIAADCERIAVENPVGFMNSSYRPADQTIHPYMFADSEDSADYVTKATCLWLKGLPKLISTSRLAKPDNALLFGKHPNGTNRTWEDSGVTTDRAKNRSKTFWGIARAMADQWG